MPKDYNNTVNLPKTDFPMRAGLPNREPGMLETFQKKTDKPVWSFGKIEEAFAFAREKKTAEDLVFIAGSLYLAGSVKAVLKKEEA